MPVVQAVQVIIPLREKGQMNAEAVAQTVVESKYRGRGPQYLLHPSSSQVSTRVPLSQDFSYP
jgi:hypothetical protein